MHKYTLSLRAILEDDVHNHHGFFRRSKNFRKWLRQIGDQEPEEFGNPDETTGEEAPSLRHYDLVKDRFRVQVSFHKHNGGPLPTSVVDGDISDVRLFVIIARDRKHEPQNRVVSSPFKKDGRRVCVIDEAIKINPSTYSTQEYEVDVPRDTPDGTKLRFEFSVAARVTYKGKVYEFSYDPEMEVDIKT